ncbi:MAG: hypothetical protein AAFO07_09335 [Bacteroidota bacterium]
MLNLIKSIIASARLKNVFLLIGFLSIPFSISKGCGPVIDNYFQGYTFLLSSIIDPNAPASFLPRFQSLYNEYNRQEVAQPRDNITEWYERYCKLPLKEDIAQIVYKTTATQLRYLRSSASSLTVPIPYALAENTFALHLKLHKCLETIDYLIYAKQCEPHVIPKPAWDNTDKNITAMKQLIQAGLDDFMQIKSHYIKLRYAYQIIRLAHYSKDYRAVLRLHDYMMPKIDNEPSLIDYWIMGHRAGALRALGDNVEASYLYSLIFNNCPSKRESAFQSFYIKTDEEWDECIQMCKTDAERAGLHALRAYESRSRAVEEMEKIYAYNANDPNLEPLIVNEIKELEEDLLGVEFNDKKAINKRRYNRPRPGSEEYIIQLTDFAKRLADEQRVERTQFWRMAQAYLELIKGDYYASNKTFELAEKKLKDPILKEQIAIFRTVLDISQISYIEYLDNPDSIENKIANILVDEKIFGRYRYFPDLLQDKLSYLYDKSDNPGKAFIVKYRIDALKPNPQEEIVDSLINIAKEDDISRLERIMVSDDESKPLLNDLIAMKATLQLSNFQVEAALETMKEMSDRADWANYGVFNPFLERFDDCIYCAIPDTLRNYNKGELLEKLISMEYSAKASAETGAQTFYELGMAYYNMSYYGYAWKAMDYFRSGASWSPYRTRDDQFVFNYLDFPFGNREMMDCRKAKENFQRTLLLSSEPELRAKAMFMIAKCDRNEFYTKKSDRSIGRSYEYFDRLHKDHSDTEFYKYIIQECKTLDWYVRNRVQE